ncbi:hypothetical protein [Bartonella tribocorum]|uniref:Uncharacterized protein n=1 Tax=Bartonella tribocorum (strain DSM 28219 / CCUG 45778 / CIP 105476 / IBS 506) TaxID=382640 RepID=A9IYB7_BART1|nr:hypothetical protein [Bartonella tribocorum]CAK02333.1 hypothetical protein BT_2315 [Bartonella tribocorum CIP 105476]CDO49670.1 hypothetical protein BM1374166_02027 [Bartonella tribocorum]
MEIDESLEWLLRSQKLTILQAALLIADLNPLICEFSNKNRPENSNIYEGGDRVPLAKVALFRAVYQEIVRVVEEGKLRVEWYYLCDFRGFRLDENPIVAYSSVSLDDLKEWLLLCGKRPKNFFPEDDSRDTKDKKYMFQDPTHPRYASKLAAAVAAWEAVNEAKGGKTVKATLAEWLRQNADQYDLHNKKTGKLKEDVIEQISSVANWEPTGGAPKTPAN